MLRKSRLRTLYVCALLTLFDACSVSDVEDGDADAVDDIVKAPVARRSGRNVVGKRYDFCLILLCLYILCSWQLRAADRDSDSDRVR